MIGGRTKPFQFQNYQFKIVLVGNIGVGKTALFESFIHQRFTQHYQPTMGADFITKTIPTKNALLDLQIWDTAGEESLVYAKQLYTGADHFIIVFDLTNRTSFMAIASHIETIRQCNCHAKITIVGNKLDLQSLRTVTNVELSHVHCKLVSAKDTESVNQLFINLAEALLQDQAPYLDELSDDLKNALQQIDLRPETFAETIERILPDLTTDEKKQLAPFFDPITMTLIERPVYLNGKTYCLNNFGKPNFMKQTDDGSYTHPDIHGRIRIANLQQSIGYVDTFMNTLTMLQQQRDERQATLANQLRR